MTDIPRWGLHQHLLIEQSADGQIRQRWSDQAYDPRHAAVVSKGAMASRH